MIRLKITKHDEEHILLEGIGGVEHYGFGTFLCNIQPNEIECDDFAKNALMNAREQAGFNGLEIWPDNRIAWGDPSHSIIMPINVLSKAKGSDWISKI